jgi:hypothetical protein
MKNKISKVASYIARHLLALIGNVFIVIGVVASLNLVKMTEGNRSPEFNLILAVSVIIFGFYLGKRPIDNN